MLQGYDMADKDVSQMWSRDVASSLSEPLEHEGTTGPLNVSSNQQEDDANYPEATVIQTFQVITTVSFSSLGLFQKV